jgi:acyl carrier protein
LPDLVREVVVAAIRSLAARGVLPRDLASWQLDGDTEIDALGIGSLGKLSLMTELEERGDVAISEGDLPGLKTLGDLARLVERRRGGQ